MACQNMTLNLPTPADPCQNAENVICSEKQILLGSGKNEPESEGVILLSESVIQGSNPCEATTSIIKQIIGCDCPSQEEKLSARFKTKHEAAIQSCFFDDGWKQTRTQCRRADCGTVCKSALNVSQTSNP